MIFKLIYNIVIGLASPFYLYKLLKKHTDKPSVGARWREYFGYQETQRFQRPIWVHAVSVGEVIAASSLIKRLQLQYPDTQILVTTTTPTGAAQACKLGVEHAYLPFDLPPFVNRFLNTVKPQQVLIMETELWPNLLQSLSRRNIPTAIVNARLSERSFQRYRKIERFIKPILTKVAVFYCQHQDDADRFNRLGVCPSKAIVTGTIKYDIHLDDTTKCRAETLRQTLDPKTDRLVWIAASTHEGEDEQVLAAHQQILQQQPNSLLILVPRHPERFNNVFQIASTQFKTTRRSIQNEEMDASTQVYLADTMGEMMTLLAASDISFVGGSLIGDKVGGHNLLEPAVVGIPSLTGPSFYNFTDITHQLVAAGATEVIKDSETLSEAVVAIHTTPNKQKKMGLAAQNVVKKNQGALDTIVENINNTQRTR